MAVLAGATFVVHASSINQYTDRLSSLQTMCHGHCCLAGTPCAPAHAQHVGRRAFKARGGRGMRHASAARRKYVPSYQNEIARKNKGFPRAKLGTAYRNWPRQYGGGAAHG